MGTKLFEGALKNYKRIAGGRTDEPGFLGWCHKRFTGLPCDKSTTRTTNFVWLANRFSDSVFKVHTKLIDWDKRPISYQVLHRKHGVARNIAPIVNAGRIFLVRCANLAHRRTALGTGKKKHFAGQKEDVIYGELNIADKVDASSKK